jgi:hypothetical protein
MSVSRNSTRKSLSTVSWSRKSCRVEIRGSTLITDSLTTIIARVAKGMNTKHIILEPLMEPASPILAVSTIIDRLIPAIKRNLLMGKRISDFIFVSSK